MTDSPNGSIYHCNTAVPMLFLFELSCILHIGTLLLFMVRDYFFSDFTS